MSSFSDRCANEDEHDRLTLVRATIGTFSSSRHTATVREERETEDSQSLIRSVFHSIALELMNWEEPSTNLVPRINQYG